MPFSPRTRKRLTATAPVVALLGLGLSFWATRAPEPASGPPHPPPQESPDERDAGEAPALPPPEPERGVLEVKLEGAEGPAEVWVTGLNVWPARSARASAGQAELRITGLPEGEVQLWARTPTQVAGPSAAVQVQEGTPARASLTLREAASLKGHVQDSSGRALAGATVTVLPPEPGIPPEDLITDAAGDFSGGLFFEPVAHLWVRAEGHVDEVVEARPHRPLQVVLEPTRSLRGRVLDARGQPIPGARVWAEGLDGQPAHGSWQSVLQPGAGELGVVQGDIPRVPLAMAGASTHGTGGTSTAADGRFTLTDLRPGALRVLAEAEGYARAAARVPSPAPDGPLELVLREGGRLFGTVRDPRGYEVAGIDVRLLETATSTQHWTASDEHGEFAFAAVRGEVRVSAYEHGTLASECERVVEGGDVVDCALTVGQPRATLQVEVRDEHGQPVPGAVVQLSEKARRDDRGLQRRRLSDPRGHAVFASLPVSHYVLEVSAPGFVTPPATELDSEGEQTLELSLQRAGEVAGTVVDSLGRGTPDAVVRAQGAWGKARTDAEGHFVLTGLPPGAQSLAARHGALQSQVLHTRVHAEQRVDGLVLHLSGRVDPSATTEDGPRAEPQPETEAETDGHSAAQTDLETVAQQPSLLSALELRYENGKSVVAAVEPGSNVAKAGFREGDVVTHVDGEAVLTTAQGRGMLRDPPGTHARVRVLRGGKPRTLRFKRPALR